MSHNPYTALATSKTPALVIYLLDVSKSMRSKLGTRTRIQVVMEAMSHVLEEMTARSMKGKLVAPRYRVAILAYSDRVWDIIDGVRTIDEIAVMGAPVLSVQNKTNTALAFQTAEAILQKEIRLIQAADAEELERNPEQPALYPAPLVCHMTDAEYNIQDPEPIARRIMELAVPDGNVLVENIFITDKVITAPNVDLCNWPGIMADARFTNDQANKLLGMSSTIPESYRNRMEQVGYHLGRGAALLFPGESPELVELGFQMTGITSMVGPSPIVVSEE